MEFEISNDAHVPEPLFNRALAEIRPYVVSFSVDHRCSGAGTLVTIHGRHGILTAAHVVDDLLGAKLDQIGIICTDQLHRLTLDRRYIAPSRFGAGPTADAGPDLAFVRLLDPDVVGTLKGKKSFYPLSAASPEVFLAIQPKTGAVCCLVGAPAELAEETGDRGTENHILQAVHFAGRAQVLEEIDRDGFDYLRVGLHAGQHGFPTNFQGFSGGGLWNIPMTVNPDIGISSLSFDRPELIGVAFYQSDLMDDTRMITCHGPQSIYTTLVQNVPI